MSGGFGKRGTADAGAVPPPSTLPLVNTTLAVAPPRVPGPDVPLAGAAPIIPPLPPMRQPPAAPQDSRRSESYYEQKSAIFSALIEAIDLAQLARLDADSAREEIRDIVNEIIAL